MSARNKLTLRLDLNQFGFSADVPLLAPRRHFTILCMTKYSRRKMRSLPKAAFGELNTIGALVTLLDAAYALDELAAGRIPDRARLLEGVRALDGVRVKGVPADRELLDAATELHLVAGGATVDLTKRGRARAAAWAEAVRRITC
jgi:hypothetical protein